MPTDSTQQQTLWRERIFAQVRSGLAMAQFCRQHGLCVKTFYRWRVDVNTKRAITAGSVYTEVKNYGTQVELTMERIAPHALRATAATNALKTVRT